MNNNLLDTIQKQYINAFAEEKVGESLVRPLALQSPSTVRRQAIIDAQNDINFFQKRLTRGVELIQELRVTLSNIDQESLHQNLEKIMQFLESFISCDELQAAADTWASSDRALILSDEFYILLNRMGSELLVNKRNNEAIDFFSLIALLFPSKAEVWLQLGEIEQNLGNIQEAQMMYVQAILIDFNMCSAHLGMTECLVELGNKDDALYSLQIAESLASESDNKQKCRDLLNKVRGYQT